MPDAHDPQQLVIAASSGGVQRLTLNNAPANLLSVSLMAALGAALAAAAEDKAVRVVVIAAAGKLFSAGHDLKEMSAHRGDDDGGRAFFDKTFARCAQLMQSIVEHPKPVIAEIDGIATAAGCQLVASCDLAIASDRSRFGVNGIDVGLFCSTPAVALTRCVAPKRAAEMLLTGEMISADAAVEFGLLNHAVPSESLRAEVDALAEVIAAKSPVAVRMGKAALREQAGLGLRDAYACASRVMVDNMIDPDAEEGIAAFLNKREPHWPSTN